MPRAVPALGVERPAMWHGRRFSLHLRYTRICEPLSRSMTTCLRRSRKSQGGRERRPARCSPNSRAKLCHEAEVSPRPATKRPSSSASGRFRQTRCSNQRNHQRPPEQWSGIAGRCLRRDDPGQPPASRRTVTVGADVAVPALSANLRNLLQSGPCSARTISHGSCAAAGWGAPKKVGGHRYTLI